MAEKGFREKRRLSQRKVSAESGVPLHTIKNLARDDLPTISLENLDALARYFGCGLDDLFDRSEASGQ
jgi:transcriptional regulator with XRE-family HTH domain